MTAQDRLRVAVANVDAYNADAARDPARVAELVKAINDAICDRIAEAAQGAVRVPINAEGQRMVLEAMGIDPDAPEIPEGELVVCPITEEDVRLERFRFEVKLPPKPFEITIELGREE